MHLNFQGVHLQGQRALARVVRSVLSLTRSVEIPQLGIQLSEAPLSKKQPGQFDVCFEPQPLVVAALEGFEGEGVELFNADIGFFIFSILLDEIKHIIYRFFRVVARNSRLDVCEELAVVTDGLSSSAIVKYTSCWTYIIVAIHEKF